MVDVAPEGNYISTPVSNCPATSTKIEADGAVVAPEHGSAHELAKRIFDVVVSALLLLALSPLFAIIALFIKVRHPNTPVFFGVSAVGRGRRSFLVWKFSTMIRDAHLVQEKMLSDNPALREEWQNSVKLKNDPRILPGVGKFLRRTSLNELPQLYNVLIGEMSLVGPRPITVAEEELYLKFGGPEILRARYSVRPGMTGLWQISGRNDVAYADRIVYDRAYLADRSLTADLLILLKTVGVIIGRRGVY